MKIIALCALYFSLAARARFPTRLAGRLNGAPLQPLGKALAALMSVLIIPGKLVGNAFSPLLVLGGGINALASIAKGKPIDALAGSLAALLAGQTIQRQRRALLAFERSAATPRRTNDAADEPAVLRRDRQPLGMARCRKDVVYATSPVTGKPLRANLWRPLSGAPDSGLALIYFHASAWQALDYGLTMQPLLRWLAEQGHVVMDAGFTLAPQADLQGMLAEVRLAAAWMKDHAGEYSVDPKRIVLMGTSGGGHLALLAAYSGTPGVVGVIACYAPTDLFLHYEEYACMEPRQPKSSEEITAEMLPYIHDHTWLDRWFTRVRIWPAFRYQNLPGGALLLIKLLGGTPDESPEAYRKASPLAYASKDCPPTLQIFGGHDFYFSAEHGRRLHIALLKCGAKSHYLELPYAEHGLDTIAWRISPPAQIAARAIQLFLEDI